MFNVLIVDDESVQREGIKDLISQYRFPFQVLEAENGMSAKRILLQNAIDILITDVRMPLMDGLELSKQARKTQQDLKLSSALGMTNLSMPARYPIRRGKLLAQTACQGRVPAGDGGYYTDQSLCRGA